MHILFDQGTPAPLRHFLGEHRVVTVYEAGWSTMSNGDLLRMAEKNGFELMVTTDQNLKYQQNLETRKIAILVLLSTSWPRIQKEVNVIVGTINSARPGTYSEIAIT